MRIALTGKIRSGKDTVGQYLVNRYKFKKIAFGDGIRSICQMLFPEIVEKGKPRWLYQTVGQGMRVINPDVWVNYLFRQLDKEVPGTNFVITDLRQQNEFEALKRNGFIILRVTSLFKQRIERMNSCGDKYDEQNLEHETEQLINTFTVDYEINNDGTLEELYQQIEQLMGEVKSKWVA